MSDVTVERELHSAHIDTQVKFTGLAGKFAAKLDGMSREEVTAWLEANPPRKSTIAEMQQETERQERDAARAAIAKATPEQREARWRELSRLVNTRKGLTKDATPMLSDTVTGDRDRFLTDAVVQCVSENRGVYTLWSSSGTGFHTGLLDTAIAAGYSLSYQVNGRTAVTITGPDVAEYLQRMNYVIRAARGHHTGRIDSVVTVPGCGDVLTCEGTMLLNRNVVSWQAMADRAEAYRESVGTTFNGFDTAHRTDTYIVPIGRASDAGATVADVAELESAISRAAVVRDLLDSDFADRQTALLDAEALRASVLSDVESAKRGLIEFQRTAYRVGLPLDVAGQLRSEAKRVHRDACASAVSDTGLTVSEREVIIARADSRLSRELTCINRRGINARELQRIEAQLAVELERLQALQRDVAECVHSLRNSLVESVRKVVALHDAQCVTVVQAKRAANAAIKQKYRANATDLQRKVWAIEKSVRRCRDAEKLAVLREREAIAKLELAAENAARREAQLAAELAERETLAGLDAACGVAEAKVI